jgi:branched-chain amino acid transport system substrate-binding protein
MKWGTWGAALAAAWLAAGVRGADEIRIGALFAVTGPAAALGAPEARTAEMLAEKLNAEGGVLGRKVRLIVKDTAGNPEKAVSFCKQLIEEERVLAILGPSTSGETLQIKKLCNDEKTLLLSCAAAETIVNPVARYVFKTPQKDSQAATHIFRSMAGRGIARVGVLVDNSGFGQAGKAQIEALAPTNGIAIAACETYDKAATDLTDILAKVKAQNVQAVINWSIVPAQAIVARNMRQIGMDVPLYQSHGFGSLKYVQQAGEAGEGILFPCGRILVAEQLPDDHPQKATLMAYKQAYESRCKEEAGSFGGYAHDAFALVIAAIKAANSTETDKVRDALENLKGFAGVSGVYSFSPTDHTGLGLDSLEMLTVRKGAFAIAPAAAKQP